MFIILNYAIMALVVTALAAYGGYNYQQAKAAWKDANKMYYNEGGRPATLKDVFVPYS